LRLFGSYARGDYNEKRGIDILVDFNDRIGIRFIKLAHELEDLFKQEIALDSGRAFKLRYLPFIEESLIHV
jgi:uncharacterized protein